MDEVIWIEEKDGIDILHLGATAFEEALPKSASHDALRDNIGTQLRAHVAAGKDMDMDGDDDSGPNGEYPMIMDTFPKNAVYSMGGKMFQIGHKTDEGGDTHLVGTPKKVEMSYTPAAAKESASFTESAVPFVEAAYSPEKGEIMVTVIRPGLSKNNRYYSPDVLRRDHKIFEGAKMFADHATDREVSDRPEGSVHNWVAQLRGVFVESDGTVKGKASIIDPQFKAKLDTLHAQGLLPQMGVSIRAAGAQSLGEFGGKKAKIVESILQAASVDFVTFAGAGGRVESFV
jgi:hypothetical protein